MSYEITWEQKGAVKRFFGDVNGDDLMRAGVEIESDSRFDNMKYVINDLLGAASFVCSANEVAEIAAIDMAASIVNAKILIAVVAALPEIASAARAYADSPMNIYPTRLFSDLAEARAWIAKSWGRALEPR